MLFLSVVIPNCYLLKIACKIRMQGAFKTGQGNVKATSPTSKFDWDFAWHVYKKHSKHWIVSTVLQFNATDFVSSVFL